MIDCYAYYRELDQAKTFTVTEQHLALLRRANVRWSEVEFGAPEIDGKRPYGNSDVIDDIAEILGSVVPEDDGEREKWHERNEDRLAKLHVETAIVLQIALSTGRFSTGAYVRERYGDWKAAA